MPDEQNINEREPKTNQIDRARARARDKAGREMVRDTFSLESPREKWNTRATVTRILICKTFRKIGWPPPRAVYAEGGAAKDGNRNDGIAPNSFAKCRSCDFPKAVVG